MELAWILAITPYGLMGLVLGIIYGWYRKPGEKYSLTRAAFFLGCGFITGAVVSSLIPGTGNFFLRLVGNILAIPIMLFTAKLTERLKNRKYQSYARVVE